jgi:preprotein translocase subunit SecA
MRKVKKVINFISEVIVESTKFSEFTDEELQGKIEQVRRRSKKESLDAVSLEWFALVQEVSYRKIGLKHFKTQLLAGYFLHQGNIVEMKTGEGKTLASTLPIALNALSGKGVHVVTVNDYLAERDANLMGKIYQGLGLSFGLVKTNSTTEEKQKSYQSDITYVTNSELVFDYLRDSSAYNVSDVVQRPFNFCLIDEIDSILIDEARTPLILSEPKGDTNVNKLIYAKDIADLLEKELHFQLDEKRRDINLTEFGYEEIQDKLGKKTLYDPEDPWILDILNALKAKYVFKLNKDYIVLNNKIVIVDEFSGRIMEDRRWSQGIHEAMEVKENVEVGGGTKTKSSITYQNFFMLYPKLSGMTGTAKTTEKEFNDIYNLDVVVLPTAKPMVRKDLPDLVYQTEVPKWKAVLEKSKECFSSGQPLLIGTSNVEKSEFLSDLFKISEIPHQVLNAKPENVSRESEIVAQAGERYAITIATNMAGRGTDIILGGNPLFKVKQKMYEFLFEKNLTNDNSTIEEFIKAVLEEYKKETKKFESDISNLPYSLERCKSTFISFYNYLYKDIFAAWEKENILIKELGGLFVLGTERHETRRIDNQLRGLSGRQGDPGISQFLLSLDDELIKVFGGDKIKRWVDFLMDDKDAPLESNLLTNTLRKAQKKVEMYNYEIRKNVFQYDEVLNNQRRQLFDGRKSVLCNENLYELMLRYAEYTIHARFVDVKKRRNEIRLRRYVEKLAGSYSGEHFRQIKRRKNKNELLKKKSLYKELWISNDLKLAESNFYDSSLFKNTQGIVFLEIIDFYWTEHLERMGYIRETINWRSYGQQNPLLEYNKAAFESVQVMYKKIRSCMLYFYFSKSFLFPD